MKKHFNSLRAYLGGIALGFGMIGLLLFAAGIPLTVFGAHFWTGLGFREGSQPTPEQLQAAASHALHWGILHRLLPLFVISTGLVAYGFYEVLREKRSGCP